MRTVMALTIIPLLAALSACATFAPAVPNVGRTVAVDPAEILLTEAALRAERAFVVLARARSAEDPLADTPLPRIVPAALLATVTLDWTGPVETLAEELARRAGYRFFRRRTCPGPPGDRRRQDQGCTADRRPARCRYPGRTGRRADGGRGPADRAPRLGHGGSFTPDREDRQGGFLMRTGAVVFLLLLMAVPVRAAAPPPDLEALYEFCLSMKVRSPMPCSCSCLSPTRSQRRRRELHGADSDMAQRLETAMAHTLRLGSLAELHG